MDLSLALIEASEGRIGATIRKMATFCFSYDPQKKTYVFNLLRVAATVTILTAAAFMTFLIVTGRKRGQGQG
jgi:protein SCO1/2